MAEKDWLLGDTPNPLGDLVGEIRKKLQGKNPETLASHTGANYLSKGNNGEFQLAFWSRDVVITFPEFIGRFADAGEELNPFDMTMLAYYFDVSDSVPLAGEWIAFKQIPGGLFYAQAFQGYSGDELLKVFGDDVDAFVSANEAFDGRREAFGSAAYSYQILPHVPIMVVCWLGDEDFPSSYRMLFDASAHHHLVTDAYAILGSHLTKQLIKAKE